MSLLVSIGIVICIIIGMVILAIIVYVKFREEEEEKDNPLGINFLANHSNGRAIGIEKEIIIGKGNRKIITLSPRDINRENIKKLDIEDVKVIVDKNKLISIPKGLWSKDKNINIYLPSKLSDFSTALKQTEFGKMLMFWTAIKNADNAEIDALQEGMKRQAAHIESIGAGELSVAKMQQIEEIYSDLLSAAKESKKDKSSSYTSPNTYGG